MRQPDGPLPAWLYVVAVFSFVAALILGAFSQKDGPKQLNRLTYTQPRGGF